MTCFFRTVSYLLLSAFSKWASGLVFLLGFWAASKMALERGPGFTVWLSVPPDHVPFLHFSHLPFRLSVLSGNALYGACVHLLLCVLVAITSGVFCAMLWLWSALRRTTNTQCSAPDPRQTSLDHCKFVSFLRLLRKINQLMLVTFSHCWQHPSFTENVSVGVITGYDIFFRLERRCTFLQTFCNLFSLMCMCLCLCICTYGYRYQRGPEEGDISPQR